MSKGIFYLEANLLPLILKIKSKKSESHIYSFLGLKRNSTQSILIQFGEIIEIFWNKVIQDSKYVSNLIENDNMVNILGKLRQIDHYFENLEEAYRIYLESKCCLNFDSEKIKASNEKLFKIKEALNANSAAYFVPVVSEIPQKDLIKYNNKSIQVYGVKWMIEQVKPPFTEEEYFAFAREVIAPILEEKGL